MNWGTKYKQLLKTGLGALLLTSSTLALACNPGGDTMNSGDLLHRLGSFTFEDTVINLKDLFRLNDASCQNLRVTEVIVQARMRRDDESATVKLMNNNSNSGQGTVNDQEDFRTLRFVPQFGNRIGNNLDSLQLYLRGDEIVLNSIRLNYQRDNQDTDPTDPIDNEQVLFGRTRNTDNRGTDEYFTVGRDRGAFRSLVLKARNDDMEASVVEVTFGNNQVGRYTQIFIVRGRTAAINFGQPRGILQVHVFARAQGGGNGQLEVYGRR